MPDDEEKNKEDAAEEVADEEGTDDTESAEDTEKKDDSADGDAESQEDEGPKPFENLDLRDAVCFGWQRSPSEKCWYNKCLMAEKFGWEKADKEGIELSLKENVDNCYFCIATIDFIDLDDETPYRAEFDNGKMMWKLSIKNSPKAELEMEQIGEFFKSELMKKVAQRVADLVQRAVDMYKSMLESRLQNGELLAVDEIKLAAILHEASTDMFMQNLRGCKWFSN